MTIILWPWMNSMNEWPPTFDRGCNATFTAVRLDHVNVMVVLTWPWGATWKGHCITWTDCFTLSELCPCGLPGQHQFFQLWCDNISAAWTHTFYTRFWVLSNSLVFSSIGIINFIFWLVTESNWIMVHSSHAYLCVLHASVCAISTTWLWKYNFAIFCQ